MTRTDLATFGGGCFWCFDAQFRLVKGVSKVESGYSGGEITDPTTEDVYSGRTGHAEVVQLTFDPTKITYEVLLDMFWSTHDPTQLNRQGHDIGEWYRSIILYHDKRQEKLAEQTKATIAEKLWDGEIVTEIKPFEAFYKAEDYHQDFYSKNPNEGYCQVVINPKVDKFRQKFSKYLSG